jgi:hypothetical protein
MSIFSVYDVNRVYLRRPALVLAPSRQRESCLLGLIRNQTLWGQIHKSAARAAYYLRLSARWHE